MVQGAPQSAGRFDAEVRMYKAPPPEVSTEAFYETDPAKDYRRGFSIQTVSPLPITWAEHIAAQGHWGRALREYMSDYVHWSCLGALCEFLPRPENRVTLAEEKDSYGLPVARFSYSQGDNDRALARAAQSVMEDILRAAGADEVVTIQRYAHLVGGARMAAGERQGVVDRNCRSFAVPNLYITDGSVLPTQGSANPALTIMAVAARAADQLISGSMPELDPPFPPGARPSASRKLAAQRATSYSRTRRRMARIRRLASCGDGRGRAHDGVLHALDVVRVDQERADELVGRAGELAQHERAGFVVAAGDVLLGHQVHAVAQRGHQHDVGGQVQRGHLLARVGLVQVVHGRRSPPRRAGR